MCCCADTNILITSIFKRLKEVRWKHTWNFHYHRLGSVWENSAEWKDVCRKHRRFFVENHFKVTFHSRAPNKRCSQFNYASTFFSWFSCMWENFIVDFPRKFHKADIEFFICVNTNVFFMRQFSWKMKESQMAREVDNGNKFPLSISISIHVNNFNIY